MQPKLSLLDDQLIARIIDEAYQLMLKPGIKVQNAEARQLLEAAYADLSRMGLPEAQVLAEQMRERGLTVVPST